MSVRIKVNNVQQLYDDVCALYNQEIETNGRKIINDLVESVDAFKSPTGWKGKDAGVQINNTIIAHNSVARVINKVGEIVVDLSKILVQLRAITNANGAKADELVALNYENIVPLEEYSDSSDTIFISDNATIAKEKLEKTKEVMDSFVNAITISKGKIFENWEMGETRELALEAFIEAENTVKQAGATLNEVVESVKTAISNWESFNL